MRGVGFDWRLVLEISMGRVGFTSLKILDIGEISMGRVGFT
jgi:hypothetical protein